jgi:TRAP-type mannitol/chloroaromatic compound transport system permease large subunit
MNATGLWMLVVLGVVIVGTGLPVWALLIGVGTGFSMFGLATGAFDVRLLSAQPSRLLGLLENDLLQALPLYVFIGVLLQRLSVADAIFNTLARLLKRTGAGVPLAALGTGMVLAPMNGSVASTSALLSRVIAPQLSYLASAKSTALVAAVSTIGVVVPPSLVLLLLGDAMQRAHLEAGNLPASNLTAALVGQRIVNTQDILSAALLPAGAVLLLWALWVMLAYRQRGLTPPASPKTPLIEPNQAPAQSIRAQTAIAFVAVLIILGLLAAVFVGAIFAVEAAATGGCLLILATLVSRALSLDGWRQVVRSTLELTGALIALLMGATMFSMVFRGFGTDQWLANNLMTSEWSPTVMALVILLGVSLSACVLDAFEMIFVIIPIVAPLLIASLGDAQQAAVLLLLLLQLSFLLPPMGYAVIMVRSHAARNGKAASLSAIFRHIVPLALAVVAIAALVFLAPRVVHGLDKPNQRLDTGSANKVDIEKQIEDLTQPAPVDEGSASDSAKP